MTPSSMQVQGSGLVRLPDGKALRIGFAGKNGHPYTSIGKILVEQGVLRRRQRLARGGAGTGCAPTANAAAS